MSVPDVAPISAPRGVAYVAASGWSDVAGDGKERARILLVDDHPIYYAGLQVLLEGAEAFEVVGLATDCQAALKLTQAYHPAIVLLDVELGEENGLDLVTQLGRICPGVKIVVLTGHDQHEYLSTAMRLGVYGFLCKDMAGDAVLAALRQVLNGERVVRQPHGLTAMLEEYSQLLRAHERERSGVTEQEIEILRLAAIGLSNKDIGAHQFLSEITVKRRLQEIYHKLNVKGRSHAVAEAIRAGLI